MLIRTTQSDSIHGALGQKVTRPEFNSRVSILNPDVLFLSLAMNSRKIKVTKPLKMEIQEY
jgi:hypothetical protein